MTKLINSLALLALLSSPLVTPVFTPRTAYAEKPTKKASPAKPATKPAMSASNSAPVGGSSSSSTSPMYVVDLNRVLAESDLGRGIREKVEKELATRREELQSAGKELQKDAEEFEKQKALLSDQAVVEKTKSLDARQKELGRRAKDHEEAIGALEQKELRNFGEVVRAAVERVAKAAKAPLVLPKDPRLVIYASDRFDLTAAVIKEVNQG